MGFIAQAEAAVNRALQKVLPMPTYHDPFAPRVQNAPSPAPVIIQAPSITPQQQAAPAAPISASNSQQYDYRRAAAVATGQSGVTLPPVGVRGAGAVRRPTLLGK